MTAIQPNPLTRADTFFGVCQALGDDLGFNPIFLRVTLAGMLFWNPWVAIASYAAGGVVVLASRLLAPEPRSKQSAPPAVAETEDALVAEAVAPAPAGDNDARQELATAA
jgi:phage shock protein C